MNVFVGHLCIDKSWMSSIRQDIRVCGGEVSIQISRVENTSELRASILRVGAKVTIKLVQRFKFRVAGSALVKVRGLVDDADCVLR